MPNRHRFSALLVALLLSSGCEDNTPGDPTLRQVTEQNGLRLEIQLARDTVAVGDTNVVTMRLVNLNSESVRLDFQSTCQILPYVESADSEPRIPGGGGWGCGAALTSLTMPANGAVTREFHLRAVDNTTGQLGYVLAPGAYRVYAVLQAPINKTQLRSSTLGFVIR